MLPCLGYTEPNLQDMKTNVAYKHKYFSQIKCLLFPPTPRHTSSVPLPKENHKSLVNGFYIKKHFRSSDNSLNYNVKRSKKA